MLQWLLRGPSFHRYFDTYSLTRESLLDGMCHAIDDRVKAGDVVLLVAHFPTTFSHVQQCLDEASMDYDVITRSITGSDLLAMSDAPNSPSLKMTLAPMLTPEPGKAKLSRPMRRLSVLVAERHPLSKYDAQIEEFARTAPFVSRLAYYLSMEDILVRSFIGQPIIDVLKQMGLNESDLIASRMISRRLDLALAKLSQQAMQERQADSPEQWLELNIPNWRSSDQKKS